jgi:hypothetical protein
LFHLLLMNLTFPVPVCFTGMSVINCALFAPVIMGVWVRIVGSLSLFLKLSDLLTKCSNITS